MMRGDHEGITKTKGMKEEDTGPQKDHHRENVSMGDSHKETDNDHLEEFHMLFHVTWSS